LDDRTLASCCSAWARCCEARACWFMEPAGLSVDLLALGGFARLELWGATNCEHTRLVRELGASPIDHYAKSGYFCGAEI